MGARTGKGEARQAAIVTAASDLLLHEGFAAVTHRAVAAAAGVPLAATTYYFSSREDLLAAAVDSAGRRETTRARAAAGRTRDGAGAVTLAVTLLDVVVGVERCAVGEIVELAAYYERLVQGARHPGVAEAVRRWQAVLLDIVGEVLETAAPGADVSPRTALALVDGLVVSALAEGLLDRDELTAALADALRPLLHPAIG